MAREGRCVLAVALILLALGVTMLYSASAIYAAKKFGDDLYFLKRQIVWAVMGIAAMLVVSHVDYRLWVKLRWVGLVVAMALLGLVLVPGIGHRSHVAQRWIRFGDFGIQPSEFARIAVLLWIAGFAASKPERMRTFLHGFVPCMGVVLVTVGLIIAERDMGDASFFLISAIVVMLAGGVRLTHLLPTCAVGAAALGAIAVTKFGYVLERVHSWYEPSADAYQKGLYQMHQSMISLGSGGVFGEGLGHGIQKLFFLPEPHSDFILAIVGEELGFLGTASVAAMFIILALAGWRIAMRARDREGFLVAFGIGFMVAAQAIVNIAVVTGSMPTKGMPLPLMSYGGSSAFFTCIALGLLINISNQSEERGNPCVSYSPEAPPEVISSPASH